MELLIRGDVPNKLGEVSVKLKLKELNDKGDRSNGCLSDL